MVFTRSSSSSSSSSQSFIYLRLRPSVFLTRIHPRLFHSRDLPFRVSFASQPKRGKKASRCLRRTPPYPPLRGLIPRITTLSDAEKKRRRGRKGRGGGRGRGSASRFRISIEFLQRRDIPLSLPWYRGKSKATYKREKRNLPSRYRIALSFAPPPSRNPSPFRDPSSFSSSSFSTLHFNALRGNPAACNNILLLFLLSPSPFNLFHFIRHSRHEQGRIPVRGSTRPINSCKTCTHR